MLVITQQTNPSPVVVLTVYMLCIKLFFNMRYKALKRMMANGYFVAVRSPMHLLPLHVCTKHRSVWSAPFLGPCGKGFFGWYSGYCMIFHMYMDYRVFLFFHFLYMVLQANSLNYSIYGSPTVNYTRCLAMTNDGVMIFVYMTRLQLARCQWCTLYVFRAHCRSIWLDMVGRVMVWPDGVFCL